MAYRCVATSVAGFVQQLAVAYVANGYWFYVTGVIPEPKDPWRTDEKIIQQYDIAVSKWTRCRRKRAGLASIQYLRYGRFWALLATHGEHPFFAAEAGQIRDLRNQPLHFAGYAIGCRRGQTDDAYHASVRIDRDQFRALKASFGAMAVHNTAAELGRRLRALGFEPYAPVRGQLWALWRTVNRRRKAAGLEPVSYDVLRQRRRPVRPFG